MQFFLKRSFHDYGVKNSTLNINNRNCFRQFNLFHFWLFYLFLLSIWFQNEIDIFEKNANNLLSTLLFGLWMVAFSNTCRAASFFPVTHIFFLRSKRWLDWLQYHSHFLIDFLSDNRKNSSIIYLFPLPSNLHQWLLIKNGNFSAMYSH